MSFHPETIHRVNFESHFTTLYNRSAEDVNLSWGAKGLLWYILSRKTDWKIHRSQLASVYQGDQRGSGSDAVDTYMSELIKLEYVTYTKQDPDTGKIIHRYDVYPMPFHEYQKMFTEPVKPAVVKPATVLPPPITNNDLEQTRKTTTGAAAPNPAVVVVSSLDQLDLSDEIKQQISKDYHQGTIDVVVGRCLRWKGRKSDTAAIRWLLENFDEYEEPATEENILEKNAEHLQEFRHLDGKKMGHFVIHVGNKYIEFVCQNMVKRIEISDRNFKSEVLGYLEYMKKKVEKK